MLADALQSVAKSILTGPGRKSVPEVQGTSYPSIQLSSLQQTANDRQCATLQVVHMRINSKYGPWPIVLIIDYAQLPLVPSSINMVNLHLISCTIPACFSTFYRCVMVPILVENSKFFCVFV